MLWCLPREGFVGLEPSIHEGRIRSKIRFLAALPVDTYIYMQIRIDFFMCWDLFPVAVNIYRRRCDSVHYIYIYIYRHVLRIRMRKQNVSKYVPLASGFSVPNYPWTLFLNNEIHMWVMILGISKTFIYKSPSCMYRYVYPYIYIYDRNNTSFHPGNNASILDGSEYGTQCNCLQEC